MADPASLIELRIDDVAYGGDGIGREKGQVVFVPGALPGETVRVEPIADRARYRRARLVEVRGAAAGRIAPVCPLAVRALPRRPATSPFCAGCAYQHAAYPLEMELKRRQLDALLGRAAALTPRTALPPVAAPAPLGNRNKIVLHAAVSADETALGYYQADNRTVIDVPACPLAHAAIGAHLAAARRQPGFFKTLRHGMAFTLRHTAADGVVAWRGAARADDPWLRENTRLGMLRAPRGSFFQVNPPVADALLAHVMELLRASPAPVALDLYCGVGVFGLAAAIGGKRAVIGIEDDAAAIEAARYNAAALGCAARTQWIGGKAERRLREALERHAAEECVLVADPPRGGLDAAVLAAIGAFKPRDVVYLSCAADKLARDARRLVATGYGLQSARLFDMFPRTARFEVAAHFTRA